jgi:hypothetical protein
MRNVRLRVYLLGLLAVFALNACQDHRLGPAVPGSSSTRMRVSTLTQQGPGGNPRIVNFTYDAQGRLSLLHSFESPDSTKNWVERTRYQYDAQNRLILEQYQRISPPGFILGSIADQHQFVYNVAGQVSEVRYSSAFNSQAPYPVVPLTSLNDPNTLQIIAYPRYNAASMITGLRRVYYSMQRPTTLESDNTYSYTGTNITFVNNVVTSNQGGVFYSRSEQNGLTYDTRANPFYGVYLIPRMFGEILYVFQSMNTLSPNNILTIGGISYRYEYNAANLPTVRYTYSDKLVETLRFTYETY